MSETCLLLEPLLYDYLHGLLAEEETASVRAHTAHCTRCQAELARWRSFDQRLQRQLASSSSTAHQVPLHLSQQVIRAVRSEQRAAATEPPIQSDWVRGGAPIATVLLTLMAARLIHWLGGGAAADPVGTDPALTEQAALLFWTLSGLMLCYAVVASLWDGTCRRLSLNRDSQLAGRSDD